MFYIGSLQLCIDVMGAKLKLADDNANVGTRKKPCLHQVSRHFERAPKTTLGWLQRKFRGALMRIDGLYVTE